MVSPSYGDTLPAKLPGSYDHAIPRLNDTGMFIDNHGLALTVYQEGSLDLFDILIGMDAGIARVEDGGVNINGQR